MKEIRFLNIAAIILFASLISACGNSAPYERYGYKGQKDSQKNYMNKLGDEHYISADASWDQKLKTREQNFNDIMKRQYLLFADNLAKDNDHTDASYFRRKGLDAARADFDLLPENPEKWNIKNEDELEALRSARLNLIDALVGYTPIVEPVKSAKAMVYYDCWLQQSQMKNNQNNKENCKKNFETNYDAIATISKDIRDKDIAEINEKYKWVEVQKPNKELDEKYKSTWDSTLEAVQAPAKIFQSRSSEKAEQQQADAAKAQAAALTDTSDKTSTTYIPGKKASNKAASTDNSTDNTTPVASAATKKTKTNTAKAKKPDTTKTAADTTAPAPAAASGTTTATAQPAKAADDKSLITDQSDKKPELVYVAYFDGKSDTLSPAATAELDKSVDDIKKANPKIVSVNGHTDRSFDSSASLITSKKRADAVRDYLISKGISKDIIRTYGFGKTDNLVENNEGEAKPANNRAEVVFKTTAQ